MTVVVVTFNSEEVVAACLRSLPAALEGTPYDVVVVDNFSADSTLAVVAQAAPDARILRLPQNRGYAAAINAAVVGSRAHALILNADVRLGPGSANRLLAALSDPAVGIAVPRLLGPDGTLQHSLRRAPTVLRALGEAVLGGRLAGRSHWLGETISDSRRYERTQDVDWAAGAVMMASRRCLDEVGLWDESFFLYSEETDYALRMRDAGFCVRYVPDAAALHIGGESRVRPDLWALLVVNRVRSFGNRHGRVRTAAFLGAVMLNELLRAPFAATSRAALRALLTGRPPILATRADTPRAPAPAS